jgi:hypothetical protein
MKKFLAGKIHEEQPLVLMEQIKFLDLINRNHFVTKLDHVDSFTQHDREYVNHAAGYARIRDELVTQIAERLAVQETTDAVKAKKGVVPGQVAPPQPEVALAQKKALQTEMSTLRTSLYVSHRWRPDTKLVNHTGKNLRRRAFAAAYEGLLDSMKVLDEKLTASSDAHKGLRECVTRVGPETPSPLEAFYQHAYMMKHALENNFVRGSVLRTIDGGEAAATALLTNINNCIAHVGQVYERHLAHVEYGPDSVNAATTFKLRAQAEWMAKMHANASFFVNAFEKAEPTIPQKVKMKLFAS